MTNLILNKFKEISDALIAVDAKLGFKKFRKYVIFILMILFIINIKVITKDTIDFIIEVSEELHNEKIKLRDKYMTDLNPLLAELRAETGADRVLYFEYHNSEENLEGIPFKFFDLVMCSSTYGVAEIPGSFYRDVGASMYTTLFDRIKKGEVVYCSGAHDLDFRQKHGGVFELVNEIDHSRQQVFFSVPGLKRPVGFIILEWMSDVEEINVKQRITPSINKYIPRINGLVLAARR